MEKKPFESKSKLSLDRILSEIAELESSQGEPDRIWSLGDINALLESTAPGSNTEQNKDDSPAEDILGSLDYLEDRYTSLPDDEQEPAAEVPADEHSEEPPVTDTDTADSEQEEIEPDVVEFAPEVSEDDNAEDELSDSDSETDSVIGEEVSAADEDVTDDTYEPEPQDEAPESATENTDNSDDEEIVTISLTPLQTPEEKRPTVEELFPSPAAKYFGEEDAVSEPQDTSSGVPGIFDGEIDENIFKKTSDENIEVRDETAESKDRFIKILSENISRDTDTEPIEKPGIILRRGPLSETSGLEPLPKVIPAEELAGEDEEATRIVGTPPFTDPKAQVKDEQDEQLVFSGFGEDDDEPESVSEDELAAELYKKRAEKKKKFVLLSKFDDDTDEASEDSQEPSEAEPQPQPEPEARSAFEYEKPEQRGRIHASLKSSLSQAKTAVIGLCIIDAVALILLLVPKLFELVSLDAPAFAAGGAGLAAANIILLLAGVYLSLPSFVSGFKSIFKGRVTCESVGSLAVALTLIHAVTMFFDKNPDGFAEYFYSSAAIFALLLNALGNCIDLKRTIKNFEFCAFRSQSSLYAVRAIENEKDAFEVGRALKMGNPEILYSGKIAFPERFIENSKGCDAADKCVKRNIIVASGVSAALALLAGIMTKDFFQGISVLTGAFCLTAPCAVLLSLAIPLRLENKTLNESGGMIAGYDAAAECSCAVAAAVDSADLFDRAACEMHGMKDFKTVRIDDVLLYATAVVLKSGGPLSDVFNRIIGGATELLPPVRDMIYEDRLGLSATIYGQRVLFGNRNLLVHHNIDVPLKSEEDRYKQSGRKVLYIAIDSQVAAMFVMKYVEDATLSQSLHDLEDNGFSLVVRTDDPNVTDELLATRFGVASKNVKITSSGGARIFRAYRDSIVPTSPAKVLHDGSALSYFKSIAVSGRLANFSSRYALFALAVQIVVAAGAAVSVFLGASAFISPLCAVIIQALTVGSSIFLEKFTK